MARTSHDWLGTYLFVLAGPLFLAYVATQGVTHLPATGSPAVVYCGYPLPCSQWRYDASRKYLAKGWAYESCNGPLIFCLLTLAVVSPVVGWHAVRIVDRRWLPDSPAPAWVVIARACCWTAFGAALGGIVAATVTAMALGWATDVWELAPTDRLQAACNFAHRHAVQLRQANGWPFNWLGYSHATLLGMACGLVPGVFLIRRAKRHLRRQKGDT